MKKVVSILIISLVIVSVISIWYITYGAITTYTIGTDVEATFNSITGEVTIRSTSGVGTIISGSSNTIDHFKNIVGEENIKTVTFSNKVYGSGKGTYFKGFLENCKNLTSINNIHYLDTSKIKNMANMFYGCSSLTSLDLSNFDTTNVTNMNNMFYGCSSLTSLNLSNFNTTNVTDMSSMFRNCNSLESLNLNNFNTTNVTNMNAMFFGCDSLTNLNLSNFDTTNVTNMGSIFWGCSSLTSLNLSNFDTTNVTNMSGMFRNCNSLESLNLNNFNTTNVTDMSDMFFGCNSLTNLDVSNFNTTNVTYMKSIFDNCSSLTSLDISNFNTTNVIDMSDMFFGCNSLTNLDVSNFNTTNVTNMSRMFNRCSSLTNLDLRNFNTTNVTNMSYMFQGCNELTSLDLSMFDTRNVTNFSGMFIWCDNLNDIYTPKTYPSAVKIELPNFYCNANNMSDNKVYKNIGIEDFDSSVHLIKCYGITYNANGGTGTMDVQAKKIGINSIINNNEFIAPESKTFVNWKSDKGVEYNPGDIYTVDSNLTLYAQWQNEKVIVTFKDGDTIVEEVEINIGETVTPPNLERAGYTLSWDKDLTNITQNTTIEAIWTAKTDTYYKVEHYKQDTELETYTKIEEDIQNLTGTTGTTVTATPNTYEGYHENTQTIERVPTGTIAGDGSLVLKLYYDRNVYNVTLNVDVGEVTGGQIAEGKDIKSYIYGIGASLPTSQDVTKMWYVFRGWFDNEECEGTAVTQITTEETGNKVYYAKWLKDTDGDGIPDIEDDDTQVPYKVEHYKQKLDKTGYELAETEDTLTGNLGHEVSAVAKQYTGFSENIEIQERLPSGIVTIDGSLVLKLYYDRNTYTLQLDVDGQIEEIEYVYGEEVTLPTDKEKPGYLFDGWYEDSNLTGEPTQKVDTSTIDPDKSPIYYIKWEPKNDTPYKVEHYVRTLDNEVIGYELYETENLKGTTGTLATATPKTYIGYTENITIIERVPSGNIEGNGNLVLKLYYDRNVYKIEYELNGGTPKIPLNNNYTYGEEVILSTRVEKPGYTFAGWYENAEFIGPAVIKIENTETGNKTYYAKWTEQEEVPFSISSEEYEILSQAKYITKVRPGTTTKTFMNNIVTNGTMKVLNSKGVQVQDTDLVGTGYKLEVEYKGIKYEYEIAVRGDIDGNGKITATDLSTLNQVLIKKITLTGIRKKAADIDGNEKITATDLSTLNQAVIKKITL